MFYTIERKDPSFLCEFPNYLAFVCASAFVGSSCRAAMVRRTQENVLADLLEKVLAYNISQIIRVRKKLSELQDMQLAAALIKISYSSPVS